jgi:uncharacterized lipoprotein YajG
MRLVVVLFAGMLAACATPASNDTGVATAESDQVCKRVTATGSNMPQRDCRTKEEWAAFDKQGQAGVGEFERARDEIAPGGQ